MSEEIAAIPDLKDIHPLNAKILAQWIQTVAALHTQEE